MASTHNIKLLDICTVTPSSVSPELSQPLTFFDIYYLKFPPVKGIFFYELADSTPSFFNSVILPRLKRTLSITLSYFLPLAGNLTWPADAAKPFIFCTPNDGVSLTVAESNADFDRLASNQAHDAVESHPYVPHLSTSDAAASILALQITLFPSKGFSIGYAINHTVLDGKSTVMFLKAWAHICKEYEEEEKSHNHPMLPPKLTPFIDRAVIQDPEGIDMEYIRTWSRIKWAGLDANPRSLKLVSPAGVAGSAVHATFHLSKEDIKKLRQWIESQTSSVSKEKDMDHQTEPPHLSTFVLAYAYALVCLVKARGIESERKILYGFSADCRTRLVPPVPVNYFGNCVSAFGVFTEAKALQEDDGFVYAVKSLTPLIERLEKRVLEGAKEMLAKYMSVEPGTTDIVWVIGYDRLGVYEVDFGWGRPKKVEFTSTESSGISMMESKYEAGGVEIGVVLKQKEMKIFNSLFINSLERRQLSGGHRFFLSRSSRM
ncbi:hypothetical protein Tsubulata_003973 [Turnera subulata]|uniref:Uncharacterized protein n=1 Tax=Turnera subulata TaxID=218843 RepID=A0A9Q0GD60_9ROSI|nr:hypothetical protein Tsubulata_003973 [Turnera subulata]